MSKTNFPYFTSFRIKKGSSFTNKNGFSGFRGFFQDKRGCWATWGCCRAALFSGYRLVARSSSYRLVATFRWLLSSGYHDGSTIKWLPPTTVAPSLQEGKRTSQHGHRCFPPAAWRWFTRSSVPSGEHLKPFWLHFVCSLVILDFLNFLDFSVTGSCGAMTVADRAHWSVSTAGRSSKDVTGLSLTNYLIGQFWPYLLVC